MGTNISSTATNNFIFHFEFKCVIGSNKSLRVCRYIDDLLIFNNNVQLELNKIYPVCLNLNKGYKNSKHVLFFSFDFDFIFMDNFLNINLYDKREFFNFYTHCITHWFSNVSKRVSVNIILVQLNRFF